MNKGRREGMVGQAMEVYQESRIGTDHIMKLETWTIRLDKPFHIKCVARGIEKVGELCYTLNHVIKFLYLFPFSPSLYCTSTVLCS